jgi:hypothetical protein
MMHKNAFDLMTVKEDFDDSPPAFTGMTDEKLRDAPVAQIAAPQITPNVSQPNPVHDLLRKAKKKKQKISLHIELQLPSEEMYKIVSENFDNGDQEIVDFILKELSDETIKLALVSALKDKYTNKKSQ